MFKRLHLNTYILALSIIFLYGFIGITPITKSIGLALQLSLMLLFLAKGKKKEDLFKLGIFSALLPAYSYQYLIIFFVTVIYNKRLLIKSVKEIRIIVVLLIYGIFSYLLNQIIEINLLSFPLFFLSFFLPMVFFLVGFKIENKDQVADILNYLKIITLVVSITAIVQFLYYGLAVDNITGGTRSAHFVGFLTSLMVQYIIISMIYEKKYRFIDFAYLFIFIIANFLSDSKYILAFTFITLLILVFLFYKNVIIKSSIIFFFVVYILINNFNILPSRIELSYNTTEFNALDTHEVISDIKAGAAGQLWTKTFDLFRIEPTVFLIGSGPGTCLSRAANSRAFDTMNKKEMAFGANNEVVEVESKLPPFIKAKTSWVTKKHIAYLFSSRWYGSLYDYRSSIISFIWEFGIFGFAILVWFISQAFKNSRRSWNKHRNILSIWYFSIILFLLLCSLVEYYLEYTYIQILVYLLLGMLFKHRDSFVLERT